MTIKEINEKITVTDKRQVMEATGYSMETVNKVLKETRNNATVLAACEDAIQMREGNLPSLKAKYQSKEPNKA